MNAMKTISPKYLLLKEVSWYVSFFDSIDQLIVIVETKFPKSWVLEKYYKNAHQTCEKRTHALQTLYFSVDNDASSYLLSFDATTDRVSDNYRFKKNIPKVG